MRKLDFDKIRSIDKGKPFIYVLDENQNMQMVAPSERDMERAKLLYNNLFDLGAFVDPDLLDPDRGVESQVMRGQDLSLVVFTMRLSD